MNGHKRFFALIFVVSSLFLSFQVTAFAAEALDTNADYALSIHYQCGSTAITDAKIEIYRVAERMNYSEFWMISEFSSYPVQLNNQDQKGWDEAALALSGYVIRDKLAPTKSGTTGSGGNLNFTELKPGLYLVIPYDCTKDGKVYKSSPFMVALPGLNSSDNTWEQITNVEPKCSEVKLEEPGISRQVVKTWDDKGFESARPGVVEVQLLKDGEIYDTVTLSKKNNWRYKWDNLDSKCSWTIVEKEGNGYTVNVRLHNSTYTLTNTYAVPEVSENLPVTKRLTGDKPNKKTLFSFVLKAKNEGNPMPEGSANGVKEISLTGAGTVSFGKISFNKSGTYEYTVYEKDSGALNYIYDSSVYTVKYIVTEKNGRLQVKQSLTKSDGSEVTAIMFTNKYKTLGGKLPQTGLLWWPVSVFAFAGVALILIGFIRKAKSENEK